MTYFDRYRKVTKPCFSTCRQAQVETYDIT
jgi:hypothetical protein